MGLREYKAKRNFSRTREPQGAVHQHTGKGEAGFLVQKHDATRLHYDFRLEMDGVLKSWAVPKGFPHKKGDRRLAVQVEDHPLEYGSFEGTIPEGNYGAGTVMLWDRGTYRASGDNPQKSLAEGKLHFWLEGEKLKGEWALIRLRDSSAEKPQWLLLKSGEDNKPISARMDDLSVKTRRTMRQISEGEDPQWESNRRVGGQESAADARGVRRKSRGAARSGTKVPLPKPSTPNRAQRFPDLPKAAPTFIEPMKALLRKELPRGADWIYEIKFDGIRLLAIRKGKSVSLMSRTKNDLTAKYPEVVQALVRLPAKEFVLDGEVAALDEKGRSSFQLLQTWHQSAPGKRPPLIYYVFDALQLDGKNLRGLPLYERKEVARKLVADREAIIRFSPGIDAESEDLIREMKARGLEGLIAKRGDSVYKAGQRSGEWVKFKWLAEQEFVIGGFTRCKGGRMYFGALLVGYYENDELLFAGKVGTGFNERLLRSLDERFKKLIRPDCPFANLPEKRAGRFGGGMTQSQMRLCTWVEPTLVCQIRFAEWTRDNHLRQPSFLGLREDKKAKEVVREMAA